MPDTRVFAELSSKERRADFKAKDDLLKQYFTQLPPLVFYGEYLFHDMDMDIFLPSIIMYQFGAEQDGKCWKRQAVEIDELVNYFYRDDVAVNPCGYWNNYPRKKLMRQVYAFVMDIDEVRPVGLQNLLNILEKSEFPMPTAITNSGSGIHFFYILDMALDVGYREKNLQNFRLAEQIYFMLHSKMKQYYKDVQRHHLGQDYRVVGSLSKYGDITTAFHTGDFWSVEKLGAALGVDVSEVYKPQTVASPKMISYARSIAKTLGLELPDMSKPREVYDFIAQHKDEAYQERERKREEKGRNTAAGKRTVGWYRDTWNRVYNHTEAGNRFNAMRGLAIVAYKCGISEDTFLTDLNMLSDLWNEQRWKNGDAFNTDNVEAIIRMFRNGERYKNTSRARLEELLGWKWQGSKRRINGRTQVEHIEYMNFARMQKKRAGKLRNPEGRPKGSGTAERSIREYMQAHPEARKCDVIKGTGRDKKTVYKYYNRIQQEIAAEVAALSR